MKASLILISITLFFYSIVKAQTEATITIVACKEGNLIIDGNSIGKIEANDAIQQKLNYGEHYIQLKTLSEKFNTQINIDAKTKAIINMGCSEAATKGGIKLFDKEVSLTGLLGDDVEQSILALDYDDELLINSAILNKKGNATIFIKSYETGSEIYRKESFNSIVDEKIRIPKKGIYTVNIYTDALFGKSAKLSIHRLPALTSFASFKTTTKRVFDTSQMEVLNTSTRVYSSGNLDHPNKTTVTINLPKNTSYWVYWIGVGQESRDKMKEFMSSVSDAGNYFTSNPLILFGLKLIPSLPMLNSQSTVNYKFMSLNNAQLFTNGYPYSYYTFKYADNITTDYSLIKTYSDDLILTLENESAFTGNNVDIKVVAFVIKSKLIMEE